MGFYQGGVDHQILVVPILDQKSENIFPDAGLRPSGETLVDGLPLAIPLGQILPASTGAKDPKHCVEEEAVVTAGPATISCLAGQQALDDRPLPIVEFISLGQAQFESLCFEEYQPKYRFSLSGLSSLSVWWVCLGIELEHIEPGKPQQDGRHERMHRTLKDAIARPPRATLRAQQKAFDGFREEYSHERPHESLGMRVPAEFYTSSLQEYPERLPRQRGYPDEWEKRIVRKHGQIKWKGRLITVTRALCGHEIGFKAVADGKWAVYFESLELGVFDERTGRIKGAKRLAPTTSME